MSERREISVDLDRVGFDEGMDVLDRFGKKDADGTPLLSTREVMDFIRQTLEPDVAATLTLREGFLAMRQLKAAVAELTSDDDGTDPKASS